MFNPTNQQAVYNQPMHSQHPTVQTNYGPPGQALTGPKSDNAANRIYAPTPPLVHNGAGSGSNPATMHPGGHIAYVI